MSRPKKRTLGLSATALALGAGIGVANNASAPPAEGTKPDQASRDAATAKSLAESLGIEESKVTAALEELRSEKQAQKASALKTRLDQAVADGKLTQAEADAVTKAVESGVIGSGR